MRTRGLFFSHFLTFAKILQNSCAFYFCSISLFATNSATIIREIFHPSSATLLPQIPVFYALLFKYFYIIITIIIMIIAILVIIIVINSSEIFLSQILLYFVPLMKNFYRMPKSSIYQEKSKLSEKLIYINWSYLDPTNHF